MMVPPVLQGVLVQAGKVTMAAQHSVLNSLLAVAVALVQPEVMVVTQSGAPEAQVLLRQSLAPQSHGLAAAAAVKSITAASHWVVAVAVVTAPRTRQPQQQVALTLAVVAAVPEVVRQRLAVQVW
jgi:hypothetical protein